MRIGMVGLGRMGGNMARRLMQAGHEVVAYDVQTEAVDEIAAEGATPARSLSELAAALDPPRAVWIMVPAGQITAATLQDLAAALDENDVVVDGGNSRFSDTVERAAALAREGVALVDAGTSGGIWGLQEGYCLMVGGDEETIERLEPIFQALAPENGYAHVGPTGAGHFTKMVHNGIEYALMQAYAEGFEILKASDFEIDAAQVAEVWRHGSVVRSWLLDLASKALAADPDLSELSGRVDDSGEGRWTVETAIHSGVPAPVIALSLFARFGSQMDTSFGNKLLAALRREFGGHTVHPGQDPEGA